MQDINPVRKSLVNMYLTESHTVDPNVPSEAIDAVGSGFQDCYKAGIYENHRDSDHLRARLSIFRACCKEQVLPELGGSSPSRDPWSISNKEVPNTVSQEKNMPTGFCSNVPYMYLGT